MSRSALSPPSAAAAATGPPRLAFRTGRAAGEMRRPLYLVAGASAAAAIAAVLLPFVASLAAAVAIGPYLVFAAVFGLLAAVHRRDHWHMASAVAMAVLALAAGVLILLRPAAAVLALTTLIIAWLGMGGLLRAAFAVQHCERRGAEWVFASGLASVLVAEILWFVLPNTAAPGLSCVFLAVDLMLWGALRIRLSARAEPRPARPPASHIP